MLRDFPWVVVRLRCYFCRRGGDARLAVLAAKYGPYITMGRLLVEFIDGCAWAPCGIRPGTRRNTAASAEPIALTCAGLIRRIYRRRWSA